MPIADSNIKKNICHGNNCGSSNFDSSLRLANLQDMAGEAGKARTVLLATEKAFAAAAVGKIESVLKESYSLNSLKGDDIRGNIGDYYRGY